MAKECKTFFISGTGTNVGKTYTTLMLMEYFAKKGHKVGAFKPIETGVNDTPQDGEKLLRKSKELNLDFSDINIKDITPVTFNIPAAPFTAREDKNIDYKSIDKSFKKLQKRCDILFIEGAGGLMVPIDEKLFMVDFAKYFKAVTLLISHGKLGCINDTLLSLNLLKQKKLPYIWCINLKACDKNNFLKTTLPYYKYYFKNPLILPGDIETIYTKLINFI